MLLPILLLSHSLAADLLSGDLEDATALITTRTGKVTLQSPAAKPRTTQLHAVETLSGMEVSCGEGANVFFALSNDTALAIHENSRVRFVNYQQQPFTADKENLDYEASRSSLSVELLKGSLSFSAERLSPLSEVVFQLPQGKIQVHRASGHLRYNETGAHISILRGIVTYQYPDPAEQDMIHAPNWVRISDPSARRGEIAESQVIAEMPGSESTIKLIEATHHASQRVLFRITPGGPAIPEPILVSNPAARQTPSPRPYRYLD
ncbi:MAG: FecR domain-containing protein [Opitutales bacterium]